MNSCVLMAQIIQDPELRYTSDNQTPIAQMLVQFPGLRAEDPMTTLKVVGWGNFANEIKENYSAGDRVVIEGSLRMNTIDRPEGFKEKRAELRASRMHKLDTDTGFQPSAPTSSTTFTSSVPTSSPKSNNVVVPLRPNEPSTLMSEDEDWDDDYSTSTESTFEPTTIPTSTGSPSDNQTDLDDIPF